MSFSSRAPLAAVAILALTLLSACATPSPADDGATLMLTSPDLDAEGYLPDSARGNVERYCGDGDNVSPELEWTGVPDSTVSFVLLMTDPSYPSYDHWVVTAIPGDTTSLPASPDGALSIGVVGRTGRTSGDYVGPCQPDNAYLYTLYALDNEVAGTEHTTVAEAKALMEGHILAEASLEAMRREIEE
jgi:Raf kinase inhibitor-like YbhB/YbcL family protein